MENTFTTAGTCLRSSLHPLSAAPMYLWFLGKLQRFMCHSVCGLVVAIFVAVDV